MSTPLYPYQEAGAQFMAARRFALLADDPRVGKTPALIRACDMIGAKRILVVCPAIARVDWVRKFAEYSDVPRCVVAEFSANRAYVTQNKSMDITSVVSYGLLDAKTHAGPWDVVIADEAHYAKNVTAQRSAQLLGKEGVIHHTKRAWFASGTIAPNSLAEMWPMLYVCGIYTKSYDAFVRDFCTGRQTPYGFKVTGKKNEAGLAAMLADFALKRTMAQVWPELPPIEITEYSAILESCEPIRFPSTEMTRQAMALERDLANAADPMALLEVMTPALSSLRRCVGLLKVKLLAERIRLLNLPKIVVFGIHRDVLEGLARALPEFCPVVIHGGTTERMREVAKTKFQGEPECRLFIGQIVAAGTNIDLSAADYGIIAEASWVPGENKQAVLRMQNMNKTRPLTCEFFQLADSVDEAVQSVCRRKLQSQVL